MLTERMALRPNEAAQTLGVSRDTIFKLIASGELRSIRVGRARLISAEVLRDYISQKQKEA